MQPWRSQNHFRWIHKFCRAVQVLFDFEATLTTPFSK